MSLRQLTKLDVQYHEDNKFQVRTQYKDEVKYFLLYNILKKKENATITSIYRIRKMPDVCLTPSVENCETWSIKVNFLSKTGLLFTKPLE